MGKTTRPKKTATSDGVKKGKVKKTMTRAEKKKELAKIKTALDENAKEQNRLKQKIAERDKRDNDLSAAFKKSLSVMEIAQSSQSELPSTSQNANSRNDPYTLVEIAELSPTQAAALAVDSLQKIPEIVGYRTNPDGSIINLEIDYGTVDNQPGGLAGGYGSIDGIRAALVQGENDDYIMKEIQDAFDTGTITEEQKDQFFGYLIKATAQLAQEQSSITSINTAFSNEPKRQYSSSDSDNESQVSKLQRRSDIDNDKREGAGPSGFQR